MKLPASILEIIKEYRLVRKEPCHWSWRKRIILQSINRKGLGLEIGPSHCPLAPRREGFNVKILDHLDKAGLIEKYAALGIATEAIEDVDYVWAGESYSEIVGDVEVFDWILSSHTIEHVPDIVRFLNECHSVLKVGGVLSMAIPDKRFCFDYRRECSSLASVIDAHLRGDVRPSTGAVVEHYLKQSNRMGLPTWSKLSKANFAEPEPYHSLAKVMEMYGRSHSGEEYCDVHVWSFSPNSFLDIIEDLRRLGFLKEFEIISQPVAREYEFLIALRRIA
jgi:SAM-dependent methyltransferase